ncbi:MAG: squalene/phytoene synthase family protein, partial [Prosthecobacter sp.]|nr:squalene/phytoene synthase family protein [Prosthecobacter sp.]
MNTDESHHERELGGQLLASVSRSFYLTLKALPRELREPISLAYLLARTADTIADTAAVSPEVRLDCLARFQALVEQEDAVAQGEFSVLVTRQFVSLQTDEAERKLMERVGDGLAWLRTMRGAPLTAIQQVLRPIIQGQMLDIQRFPSDGQLRSLKSAEDLHEYTWLVAGCVGEFWTEMCAVEKPGALDPAVSLAQMKVWGAQMGRGLQLINILRDIGEDIDDGRCYLPEPEWRALGLAPEAIQSKSAALRPVWQSWLKICRSHLDAGLRYVQHVTDGKLRYATALPLLLGAKTVAKLEAASWEQVLSGVKISRLDVAMILAETAVACRSAERM